MTDPKWLEAIQGLLADLYIARNALPEAEEGPLKTLREKLSASCEAVEVYIEELKREQ